MVNMTKQNIAKIEILTEGQNTNELWFSFRKSVVTASKCHYVLTKMAKVAKGGGGYVDM